MPDPANCPKYLPANNPARVARDCHIINYAAQGLPPSEIAKQPDVPINRRQIANILSDEDAKEKLNNLVKLHISESIGIQSKLINIAKGKRVNPITKEAEAVSPSDQLKAIAEHNKIIGIAGSHTSVHIENLYQQNNTLSASAETLGIVSGIAKAIGALAQVPQEEGDE